jgi:hypothetical protein
MALVLCGGVLLGKAPGVRVVVLINKQPWPAMQPCDQLRCSTAHAWRAFFVPAVRVVDVGCPMRENAGSTRMHCQIVDMDTVEQQQQHLVGGWGSFHAGQYIKEFCRGSLSGIFRIAHFLFETYYSDCRGAPWSTQIPPRRILLETSHNHLLKVASP